MKKKNNSGFTLVELIIVVALLAIMMGAILKLLDPIRSVYKDTYDTVNTKTVGETMISFVEDKVRYSTNVLVLENYVGVPKITPVLGKKSAKVGASKYEYTNVIVVDNTNIRGSMFNDYKGDTATTYARKNCKGCIYEIKDIGESDTLDLTKASAGTLGEDIYGDYDHDIKINTVDEDSLAYLSVDVLSTPKKYDGSGYVRDDENNFKAQRSFDLVNINISEKKVNRTHDRYALDKCTDFDDTPDYTSFPQETNVPGGLTSKQQKYFETTNPNNKYTYIFFVINKTDSTKCAVNFMYDPSDPSPAYAGKAVAGCDYNVTAGQTLNTAAVNHIKSVLDGRSGSFSGYCITDGENKVDLSTYTINDDITFIVTYSKDENAVYHTAKYYNPDGSLVKDDEGNPVTSEFNNGFAVEYLPDLTGLYDPNTQYVEWYVKGLTPLIKATDYKVTTTSPDGVTKAESKTIEYYSEVKDMWKISFKDADGNDYITPYYVKDQSELREPTEHPTKSSDTGVYIWKNWYCGGHPINEYRSIMNGDSEFTPKYDYMATPPSPSSAFTVSCSNAMVTNWDVVSFDIVVNNNSSVGDDSYKLVITVPSGYDFDGKDGTYNSIVTKSGNKITITSAIGSGGTVIPANGSHTFRISTSVSGIGTDQAKIPSTLLSGITATVS